MGKSHIAQALGGQLIRSGHTVFYLSIFDAIRDLLHDEAFDGHDKVMVRYLKPELLILDTTASPPASTEIDATICILNHRSICSEERPRSARSLATWLTSVRRNVVHTGPAQALSTTIWTLEEITPRVSASRRTMFPTTDEIDLGRKLTSGLASNH